MKTAPLLYLALIMVTSLVFAFVYSSFRNVVETYPGTFSIGLVTVLLVGMYGITDNIIFSEVPTRHIKK